MTTPFVAIWMLTYNHKDYIAQAIEGVIKQRTNFPIRLYLGEDSSTDGTREICINYKNQYPDLIELLLTPKNNIIVNARNTYNACLSSGAKYMALCDGDDVWTDSLKLQKQVDFLEGNPDYAICFHNLNVKSGLLTNTVMANPPDQKETTTLDDLLKGFNYIGAASCIFRTKNISLPEYFYSLPFGDYFLHLSNARFGKIKFLNETMATYRIHSGGVHGNFFNDDVGKAKAYQQHYLFWTLLKKHDSFEEDRINWNIIESCAWVIQKALETKDFPLLNNYNFKYIRAGGSLFDFVKNYVRFIVYFFRNNSHR